ncbi:hypothetical protein [Ramlibacter sp. AN1133]|uniref:hypothetical protein n=1 Tax=Ramlibacter sp. AN1133 TaxID=3133429 RepID=UPI0030BE1AB5
MIIGRETRKWRITGLGPAAGVSEYVAAAISKQAAFFDEVLRKTCPDRGRSFHNFTRRVGRTYPNDAIIYANLFCFAWNAGNPLQCKDQAVREKVKRYSEVLLRAQLRVLKPDIVIFAHGVHRDVVEYRRSLFPTQGPNAACTESRHYDADIGIPKDHLWSCKLPGSIRCFRIQHPSSTSPDAVPAQDYLVATLMR